MIQNVNSGLYLEVDGGKTENGANVQQWGADEPASHNTWRVLSDGDGYYTLYPQIGDKVSYLLDISGNSPDNGTNAGIWSATDADAQRFKFYQASDGIYYLLTKASGDQSCVAVQAASKDSGANVVQWAVNLSDTSQQWKLTQVSDTGCTMDTSKTYMFRNTNSGLYMEVANGKAEDNSNVQQWGANEPAAHNSWTLKEFGGGYYYIISQLADGKTYYAFVKNGVKYIVLDACFNNDEGEHYSLGKLDWQVAIVPKMEMEWFRKELATGKEPVVVFCHQLVNTWDEKTQNIPHAFFVQNAAEVVDAMEKSGRVLAFICGHFHKGAYSEHNGIHYIVNQGLVERPLPHNVAGMVHIDKNHNLYVEGLWNERSHVCKKA